MAKNAETFDCSTCKHKHCDTDRTRKGSIGPASYNLYEISDVIDTNVCLLPMVTYQSNQLLKQYTHYKNQLLPYAGGTLEQPNGYTEAMSVISNYIESQ